MNLTTNFTLEELTFTNHREFDNTPNNEQIANLCRLAKFLELLRALVNRPIYVDSAFRSLEINRAIGSKDNSQHCLGCAADIKVLDMSPYQVMQIVTNSALPYDQAILEFNNWTHVSIPNQELTMPRKMALVIDKTGTRNF
jgi:hypothetical protein